MTGVVCPKFGSCLAMEIGRLKSIIDCSLDSIECFILQISSTNAKRSVSFSNAYCLYDLIKDEEGLFWSFKFTTLFDEGVRFLSELKNMSPEELEGMDEHKKAAVRLLNNFYRSKGNLTNAGLRRFFCTKYSAGASFYPIEPHRQIYLPK